MKKTVSVALTLVFLLGLSVSGALAYTFNDNTLVQNWNQGAAYGGGAWQDVIGDTNVFDTFGANLSGNTFTIFTNWNPSKDGDLGYSQVKTADLFIDVGCNGTWDFAVRLDTAGQGNVYANPLYNTSNDIFAPLTSLIYGGKYNEASPTFAPVEATSAATGSTSVVWTLGSGGLNNQVAVDLTGLASPYCFFWGTATCANDGFSDKVPLPPSVLLLGSGLLGLGLVRWRRQG
jgi:hypothetical protein